MGTAPEIHSASARPWWRWAGFATLALTAVALAIHFKLHTRAQALLRTLLEWLATLGAWGPILYILLYIVSCVIVLPASILTIGAGAVFGVVKGSILVNI